MLYVTSDMRTNPNNEFNWFTGLHHRFKFVIYKDIYNIVPLEVMVGITCVSCLIVVKTTINQLESNVSLIKIYCLRLFVVVYKDEML